MDVSHGKLLIVLIFGIGMTGSAGCTDLKPSRKLGFWPFNQETTDTVPGIPPPAERIAVLRKMGKKASWAKPDEQERISGELAAAFRVEADPLIRMEIVHALSGYPTAASASVLHAALSDSDADVRVAACEAWGKRGGAEAAATLSGVLSSDVDVDVRLTAARALGETGDPGAVAALGEALEDRNPAMQYRAVSSLRKISGEDFGNDVNRWRQYAKGEMPAPAEPISVVERMRRMF